MINTSYIFKLLKRKAGNLKQKNVVDYFVVSNKYPTFADVKNR